MNLPVFTALKNKMYWHQSRQSVLAQNIANASTPGYVAKDLAPLERKDLRSKAMSSTAQFGTLLTNEKHIAAGIRPTMPFNGPSPSTAFEITPDDNSVVLEEQMMKLAGNQMDYQAATSLYSSNLGLLRTAMGAGGNR